MPRIRKVGRKSAVHRGPDLEVPEGESDEIAPRFLLLDPHNLRLLERRHDDLQTVAATIIGQKSIQDRLFEAMLEDPIFDVASLERSIIYNGFLKHERLIVARYDGQYFLVLEGNRRLTAVKSIYLKFGPNLG